jgi:hypothetical protein
MIRSTLRFQTSRFNHSKQTFRNGAPLPYGEDLAEWLRAQLQATGWRLSEPVVSRDSWSLQCSNSKGVHSFRICWQGTNGWQVVFERSRSLISTLLGRSAEAEEDLVAAIQSSLSREPAIQRVRWMRTMPSGREFVTVG